LKEHINSSAKHKKLKKNYLERDKSGKQLTIEETQVRLKAKEQTAESVCHAFVYSLSLAGIPLQSTDGPLGQFARKWIPAARNMSTNSGHLRNKYLTDNFERHTDCIKHKIKKISLVFDESPDIIGRKTVNSLCSFCDDILKLNQFY